MKASAALAAERLAALFGPDTQPTLRRISERPVSVEAAAAQSAIWAALADAGGLCADEPGAMLPIAELMGASLDRSPYLDTVTAIDAITALGESQQRQELLNAARDGRLAIAMARHDLRFVRCADTADMLLVINGPVLTLIDLDQAGVQLREHHDLGRGGLFEIRIPNDVTPVLSEAQLDPQRLVAVLDRDRLRRAAYLAGLCQGSLEHATSYVRQRIIFGRALGSYQAPAFRLAALAARLEAVRSLIYRGERPTQALRLARELAIDITTETLQLHGASGLLEGNDAQLFYRRALTEAALSY